MILKGSRINELLTSIKSKAFKWIFPSAKGLIQQKMPRLMKQQLLLISAVAVINQIDKPSDTLVEKLSKLIKVNNRSMIDAGIYIKDYTWSTVGKDGICVNECVIPFTTLSSSSLQETDKDLIAGYFADRVPTWLKYGSRQLIMDDLRHAFNISADIKVDKAPIHS